MQKVDIKRKRKAAQKVIDIAAFSAGAIGTTPIPFADAIAIIPIQIGMLVKVSAIFGLHFSQEFLRKMITLVFGIEGATMAGRILMSNLLRFVPDIGSVAGD